jgi:ATP-dependent DNA ligase
MKSKTSSARQQGKLGEYRDKRNLAASGEPAGRPAAGPPGVHWVEPRLVGQIGFTERTGDGQLRHPRFQGLRDDKKPADVVREMPS